MGHRNLQVRQGGQNCRTQKRSSSSGRGKASTGHVGVTRETGAESDRTGKAAEVAEHLGRQEEGVEGLTGRVGPLREEEAEGGRSDWEAGRREGTMVEHSQNVEREVLSTDRCDK